MLFSFADITNNSKPNLVRGGLIMKHDCWNCLYLTIDKVEETKCNKGNELFPIFNVNECSDWYG